MQEDTLQGETTRRGGHRNRLEATSHRSPQVNRKDEPAEHLVAFLEASLEGELGILDKDVGSRGTFFSSGS